MNTSNNEVIKAAFRDMLRIRRVEEEIADRYSDQEMRCPVHLSIGQEAAAVGVCSRLAKDDRVFSTHRCHAHYLARGGDLNRMLGEIYGKATGCVGGRGGSMHLADHDVNFHASIPVIGSSIALAVGTALSDALTESPIVTVAFFGDSSVEEGIFHESMNFAAIRKLPILFVCENNQYSIYTPIERRQPSNRALEDVALAHGVTAMRVDGNAVTDVQDAAGALIDRARSGEGPGFLVLDTYRHREHCGPGVDDHLGYRDEGDLAEWLKRCPIETTKALILDRISDGADWVNTVDSEIKDEINAAFEKAISDPFPDPDGAARHVYV